MRRCDKSLGAQVDAIADALLTSGNNKSKAARLLGITRNGLALKLKRLGFRTGDES